MFREIYSKPCRALRPGSIKDTSNYHAKNEIDTILTRLDFDSYAELYVNEHLSGNEMLAYLLTKYKEKVLFIDFWATWCIPCYDDFAKAKELKDGLDLSDIAFIYICSDSEKSQWIGRIQENHLTGVHIFINKAQRRELFNRFNFQGYPSYSFVDRSGKVELNARWLLNDPKKGRAL